MKNLLIYINPNKYFNPHSEKLIRVQIDNSLNFGWKKENILLVTNFSYKYKNISSLIVSDDNCCLFKPWCSKIYAIVTLFRKGVIENDLYWYHDSDAFQLEKDINPDLGIKNVGMVAYNGAPKGPEFNGGNRWNSGVMFFNNKSEDIFKNTKEIMEFKKFNEERSLMKVEIMEKTKNPNHESTITKLNYTFNFVITMGLNINYRYKTAEKPIKIIHYDPFDKGLYSKKRNTINNILDSKPLLDMFKINEIN